MSERIPLNCNLGSGVDWEMVATMVRSRGTNGDKANAMLGRRAVGPSVHQWERGVGQRYQVMSVHSEMTTKSLLWTAWLFFFF